ncbi:WSC-domain-containing protein [Acephala macrosclerotiorum]|nr:WSC-domain-containing protein [Acephala macrosclerotiorum]
MTLEACATDCAGYAYFGVEYGGECWCANTLDATSALAPVTDCYFVCPGNSLEYCGAGNRLELYTLSATSSSSSLLPSSSSSIPVSSSVSQLATSSSVSSSLQTSSTLGLSSTLSSSTSSSLLLSSSSSITTTSSSFSSSISSTMTSSSVAPTLTLNPLEPPTVGTFNYIGCFSDLVSNVRTLPSNILINPAMTLEMCAANCAGYNYFGTEYGIECYCGYTLSPTLRAAEPDCNAACGGNSSEICGTGARLSAYQNTLLYAPPPAPVHVAIAPVDFQWLSCYTEGSASRALTGPSFATNAMTVEACTTFCAGYAYAGVEYAPPATDCSMLCAGNSTEYCGASNRLDMYQFNPALASTSSTSSVGFGIAAFSSTAASSSSSIPTTLSTIAIPPSFSGQANVVPSSSPPATGPSTNIATTTSGNHVPTSTPLLSSTTPAVVLPSGGTTNPGFPGSYQHLGCFQDLTKNHALPLLFANSSVTPELCEAYVLSLANKPTPTILPYFAVEYHNECYGGTALAYAGTSATSLYGKHACTDVCSGSIGAKSTGTAMCGGRKQFNLYASGAGVGFQAQATVSV